MSHESKRILLLSSDILPYPGMPTVGSGLRTWGLGHGLKGRGHEVMFSIPRVALKNHHDIAPPDVLDLAWEHNNMTAIVRRAAPDIIVACNWPVLTFLQRDLIDVPVILDQHGPHALERAFQNFGQPGDNARQKIESLQKADFFTCAGKKQWAYFQDWLARAGWSEQERRDLTGVIPVSLSPELPARQPDDELTFVYGGVFLPWQDPTKALFALLQAFEQHQRGKLYFYAGKHPVYPIEAPLFESLLEQLQQSPYVVAPGMVSHDVLIDRYTRAHVAVDVMKRNQERELAFTTRTVEYLWCGLPVIYHDYAELSDYIRKYEAGWTVDPEDRTAIDAIFKTIFEQPQLVAERSANAQRLIRAELTWDKTIAVMDDFIRQPQIRPHPVSYEPLWSRHMRYLLNEAVSHYRQRGLSGLWEAGIAYLKRQASFK